MKIYIDDIRTPKQNFNYIARTSRDAIRWMKKYGCPNYISFDHDLGGEDTAMIVVKWMIEMDLDLKGEFIPTNFKYNVHSANPVGKANIEGYFKAYLKSKSLM